MKDEKVKIIDESGDKNFFTIIPNCIMEDSTSVDQALYLNMKRFAGESGKCFATQKTLMRVLKVSDRALRVSLDNLSEKGWITKIASTEGKTRPINTYKINNIWSLNNNYFQKKINVQGSLSKKDKRPGKFMINVQGSAEEEPIKEDKYKYLSKDKQPEVANTDSLKEKTETPRPKTDIQKIIDHFFSLQGWSVSNNPVYKKYLRPAKELLECTDNDVERAVVILDRAYKWARDAGFDWSISTVIKHFHKLSEEKQRSSGYIDLNKLVEEERKQ